VEVEGRLLYSKKKLGRHAEQGEVLRLIREFQQGGPRTR
jgi:hypothetical protein